MQQIKAAWEDAQKQLEALRAQVNRNSALAMAKVDSNTLTRELDQTYRALGEAVWGEVSAGRLALPSNLSKVSRALEDVQRRIYAQRAAVTALLQEGEEVAAGKAKESPASKSGVAPKGRKR